MRSESCWIWLAVVAITLSTLDTTAVAAKTPAYFFPDNGIGLVRISPGGDWMAATAYRGESRGVLAQRIGRPAIQSVFSTHFGIRELAWVGRNTLLVQCITTKNEIRILRIELSSPEGDEALHAENTWISAPGRDVIDNWMVSALPNADDFVVWEFEAHGKNTIHRVALEELKGFLDRARSITRNFSLGEKLATIDGSVHRWIVDVDGEPVAALRRDESGYTILAKIDKQGQWSELLTFQDDEEEDSIIPLALQPGGASLVVKAYNGQDTLGLYELSLENGKLGALIYHNPEADIDWVVTDDATGDLVSVRYEIGGAERFFYFDAYRDFYRDKFGADHDFIAAQIVSGTADRQLFVYRVSNSTDPGTYYLRDVEHDETILVGKIGQSINRRILAPTINFAVESSDGTVIESFLTLPREASKSSFPLVVYPHGGPVDVRDNKSYDPIVQYLASTGFAVLQPNYRGSAGYGRSFRDSAKGEWGQRIEDDIDAAVAHATARPDIDAARVCIVGGSYGGFSAISSIIRHKDLYQCAVSINGVSDIPLMAESSDIADSKRALAFFEEFVGDLETERDKLLAVSPAYRVHEIETPILVIYGDEDRRVDADHGHRMILMLSTLGKEYEEIVLKGAAHSFTRREWVSVLPALKRFLSKHLSSPLASSIGRRRPESESLFALTGEE